MSTILVTGAGGFIGRGMVEALKQEHTVVALYRSSVPADAASVVPVRGDFTDKKTLNALAAYPIDKTLHLAAVTGRCEEAEGVRVNVYGTFLMLQQLIGQGCTKFVLAGSIAAVGLQRPAFRPLAFPVPDEHPCLDSKGYGFSKYMVEEVCRYFCRQNPELDFLNLRCAAIFPDDKPVPLVERGPAREWALAGITRMTRRDIVRAYCLALDAEHRPGVRILNAVSPKAWATAPTAELVRDWCGTAPGLEYYDEPGKAFAGVFACDAIQRELGFVARDLPEHFFPDAQKRRP